MHRLRLVRAHLRAGAAEPGDGALEEDLGAARRPPLHRLQPVRTQVPLRRHHDAKNWHKPLSLQAIGFVES
jgi:hypothetical protein